METMKAYIEAMAAASVAVKKPNVTPKRIMTAVKSARSAFQMVLTPSLNETFSPFGYRLTIDITTQTARRRKPSAMPGTRPAMKRAPTETPPAARE